MLTNVLIKTKNKPVTIGLTHDPNVFPIVL